jgi:hypothetical protein
MKQYLKVKIKSLAQESRIIKQEFFKAKRSLKWHRDGVDELYIVRKAYPLRPEEAAELKYNEEKQAEFAELMSGLQSHRVSVVQLESRCSQLAYAYMRGVPYSVVEQNVREQNKIKAFRLEKVAEILLRFDPDLRKRLSNSRSMKKDAMELIKAWIELPTVEASAVETQDSPFTKEFFATLKPVSEASEALMADQHFTASKSIWQRFASIWSSN